MDQISPWVYILITFISGIVVPIIVTSFSNNTIMKKAKEEIKAIFEKKFNENRWNLYMEFVLLVEQIMPFAGDDHFPFEKFDPSFSLIGTKMMLISSDDVVEKYGTWRAISSVNGIYDPSSMRLLFDLISNLRIDLGNDKSKLGMDRLLKCIVPNYQRAL